MVPMCVAVPLCFLWLPAMSQDALVEPIRSVCPKPKRRKLCDKRAEEADARFAADVDIRRFL
eukprot:6212514-Pleurochrysis_carterae.AAC.2